MKRELLMTALTMTLVLLMSSCRSSKNFVYLQDMKANVDYQTTLRYEATIHSDDRLVISVSSKNPELALPFNSARTSIKVDGSGNVSADDNARTVERGYRVDADGYIDFPLIGKIYVEGLTMSNAETLIKQRIIEGKYLNDPLVQIEFLNFKYTVLGAVSHTGTFATDGDHVTIFDAIARAGDLAPNARIDQVSVIREVNGERKLYVHDLRDKATFDSPAYYLQQNDIVYVEPKYRKKSTEDRGIQYGSLVLSTVTAVCSLFWAIK